MQALNQIKDFQCQQHPSEVIKRVCLDSSDDSSLKCIECIINDNEKVPKDSIIALNEFVDHAAQQYQSFQRISPFETVPPEELISFLAQEDENIAKFSQYVEQEKQRVNYAFDAMIQEFTQLCFQRRNHLSNQLDKQLATLKFNYSYYRSKLDRYYNKENEFNPNREALISRINQCQDTNQAEVIIKNIKDDLLEASSSEDLEQKVFQINESFNSLAQTLQNQAKSLPKTKFFDQTAMDASLSDFKDAADSLMKEFVHLNNQISELSFTNFLSIDSKLIKKQEDLTLIKEWLAPRHTDVHLKLLYRGSRDGMSCEMFHEKCDKHDVTLTIAKSNHGKVFGGYSDKSWIDYGTYKPSWKCWLFSIDEKLKFPMKEEGYFQAIFTHRNYGPTFGSGHDLHIHLPSKDSDGDRQSSSQLGAVYQMNENTKVAYAENQNLNQTILAGSYLFDVEELEIYTIEKKTKFVIKSKNPEFDSEIIDPEQDLNLIKSWLGTGKNRKFKLIYRASRDGFRAEDFHRNCDKKGPTLVICKSKYTEKVFGGFTSKNWAKTNSHVADQEAFLFSLTHKTKHPVKKNSFAIFNSGIDGPVFGQDLWIGTESHTQERSSSALGVSYEVSGSVKQKKSYFAGEDKFFVEEIEVFTVKSS